MSAALATAAMATLLLFLIIAPHVYFYALTARESGNNPNKESFAASSEDSSNNSKRVCYEEGQLADLNAQNAADDGPPSDHRELSAPKWRRVLDALTDRAYVAARIKGEPIPARYAVYEGRSADDGTERHFPHPHRIGFGVVAAYLTKGSASYRLRFDLRPLSANETYGAQNVLYLAYGSSTRTDRPDRDSNPAVPEISFMPRSTKLRVMHARVAGGFTPLYSRTDLPIDKYTRVEIVANRGFLKLYINGALDGQLSGFSDPVGPYSIDSANANSEAKAAAEDFTPPATLYGRCGFSGPNVSLKDTRTTYDRAFLEENLDSEGVAGARVKPGYRLTLTGKTGDTRTVNGGEDEACLSSSQAGWSGESVTSVRLEKWSANDSVYIDGAREHAEEIKIYASDPWQPAAKAMVRDLAYTPLL